jgi:small-conductance mechanosensitive channel
MKLRVTAGRTTIDAVRRRFDDARMLRWRAIAFLLLASVALRGFGQEPDSAKFFDAAQQQIADVRKQLGGEIDETKLNDLRDVATSMGASADALVADRAPKLDALDARIAELGPAPAKGTPPEAADIAAQRATLAKERTALDAEIKRAKLLSVDAQQLFGEIAETRRSNFQARLSQRTPSPLTPTFWKRVVGSSDEDRARLDTLLSGVTYSLADAFAPDNRVFAIAGIAIGLFLIVFGRWWAERMLMRVTADRVPQGRLRRSALALAIVVVATVFTGVGAQAAVTGLDWHGAFTGAEEQLAHSAVIAVFFGSFVAGLGRALLSPTRPSWRLPPIADDVATALRPLPWLLGAAIAVSIMLRRINGIAGASLSATVAASFVSTIVYAGIVIWSLLRVARMRRQLRANEKADAPEFVPALWSNLVLAAFWIAALTALIAACIGFVAFGQFVAALIVRVLMVMSAFFLVIHFIEDLFFTLGSARARWMQETLGMQTRTLDQLAVVLSGAFRIVAFLFALSFVFAGFGSGRAELSNLGAQIGSSALRIGQIEITPDAVLGAIAVFLLGMLAVRAMKGWLHDRYLPTTTLDPAMRSSVTTLLGYTGGIVVFAFALSELGLSVERIAWVASALSVGIGFGLQAVVQNFVSGLILLVERPVKVGDWVQLGDVEGDIRRINVRATEIQMGDRSTMIVPNSELITKTVRNVTLANSQGRVRVRLPMPLDTDADAVIAAMTTAFTSNSNILDSPTLSVTLDGIENGALLFVGVAFIDNPRQSGAIRSDILLDILGRLRDAGIRMVTPQELMLQRPGRATDSGVGSAT